MSDVTDLLRILEEQNKVIEDQYSMILWLGKYIRELEEENARRNKEENWHGK